MIQVLSMGHKNVEFGMQLFLPLFVNLYSNYWNNKNLTALSMDHQAKLLGVDRLFKFVNGVVMLGQIYTKFKLSESERVLFTIGSEVSASDYKLGSLLTQREIRRDMGEKIASSIRGMVRHFFELTSDLTKKN